MFRLCWNILVKDTIILYLDFLKEFPTLISSIYISDLSNSFSTQQSKLYKK